MACNILLTLGASLINNSVQFKLVMSPQILSGVAGCDHTFYPLYVNVDQSILLRAKHVLTPPFDVQ